MKKSRLLVLAVASAALCAAAVGCGGDDHEHEYGSWDLTQKPTLTEEGSATRTCTANDGGVETVTVPNLSDTAVWTSEVSAATHTAAGKTVYTSEYGTVEIPIPQGSHEWGTWQITKAPTATEKGSAKRVCTAEDGTDEIDLPVLTDTKVWKKDAEKSKPATHTADGKDVYTSEYGAVEVKLDKNTAHDWGEWKIVKDPSFTEEGSAERTCTADDGGKETQTLVVLSNTLMWTKDAEKSKPATHTEDGEDVYTSVYGTVKVTLPKDEDAHDWGDWEIIKEPTLTEVGSAKHTCTIDGCKKEETKTDVPVLTDTTVWTKDAEKSKPNSHTEDGEDVYTSEYGTVKVTVPKSDDHVWGDWEIIKEPTLTEVGSAKHACTISGCTEEETKTDVPVLTDTSVWTKETVAPTYVNDGKDVYTSEYGTVELAGAKRLVAPYEGKTYIPVQIELNDTNASGASVTDSWTAATIAIDEKGTGTGTAFPYMNETWTISMVDAATGKISISSKPADGEAKVYEGFVDMKSGVIVRPRDASWSTVFVFLPYGWETGVSKVSAAALDGSFAVTYSKESVSESYFISDGKVEFGVTIASDKAGTTALPVEEIAESELVYIVNKGAAVASYARDKDGAFVPADGYEGTYTLTQKGSEGDNKVEFTVEVSGSGIVVIKEAHEEKDAIGSYTAAPAGASYTASAYFEYGDGATVQYYEITLNSDFTGIIDMPMVTVTYDLNGTGTMSSTSDEFNKNVAIEKNGGTHALATPADTEAKKFIGWYSDAACTQPVNNKTVLTGDITLYAKWADKGSITVVVEKGEAGTVLHYGDGVTLAEVLGNNGIDLGVDVDNWRVFRGWYSDAAFTKAVSADAVLSMADSGKTIYAKWEALPVYYGEYEGHAMNTDVTYHFAASLTIDENGKVVLHRVKNSRGEAEDIEGTVIGYTEATQLLTWQKADGTTYNLWFDAKSGIAAFASDMTEASLGQNCYIVSRNDGDTVASDGSDYASIGFYNGSSGYNSTHFVAYENENGKRFMLVYTDKIYADVDLFDHKGDALTLADCLNSQTIVVKQGDVTVLAFGSTGTKVGDAHSVKDELGNTRELKLLDSYYGKYTVGGKDYVFNGLGQIDWEGKGGEASASYTFVEEANGVLVFDVFERKVVTETKPNPDYDPDNPWSGDETITKKAYEPVGYYRLNIDKTGANSSFEKVMVTVITKNPTGAATQDGSLEVNAKVPTELPVPADTATHVFRGWFDNEDCTGEAITKVTYEAGTTPTPLYANWVAKAVVTFDKNYTDAPTAEEITVAAGETCTPTAPKREGYSFKGWFTLAEGGEEWKSGETVVTQTTTLYAHWEKVALPYEGSYFGVETYYASTGTGGTVALAIDADGVMTGKWSGTVESYDTQTKKLTVKDGDKTYYFWYEPSANVLINSHWNTPTQSYMNIKDFFVFVKGVESEKAVKSQYAIKYGYNNGTEKFNDYWTRFLTLYQPNSDETKDILVFNDKIYTEFSIKDTSGNAVAISEIKDKTAIIVTVNDEQLFAVGTTGNNFADSTSGVTIKKLDSYYGSYDAANPEGTAYPDKVVLDGVGNITFGTKKGTYTAVTDKEYTFDVNFGDERWWLTVDKSAGSISMEMPVATIAFDMNGHGEDIDSVSQNVTKEFSFNTLNFTTKDGDLVFTGWYDNEDCNGEAITSFTPTEKGKTYTFYAKWATPHALYGVYKGVEFDTTALRANSALTLTIDAEGNLSGNKTGKLQAGANEGEYTYDGKPFYYDSVGKTILVNNGSGSSFGTDLNVFILVENADVAVTGSYKSKDTEFYIVWDSNKTKLAKVNIGGKDIFFFVYNGKVYGDVTVKVNETVITDLTKVKETAGNVLTITNKNGDQVGKFAWNGSAFLLDDGTAGTYAGSLGEINSDGYGTFTLDGTAIMATVEGKKLTFVVNNSMKVVELGTGTYTQVEDGYKGDYTLPEGGILTLDGLGGAGAGITYVVEGTNITVYNSDGTETAYGIDVENNAFLGKSIFAGLTFTNSSSHYVQFADSADIAGKMIVGNVGWVVDFTGELVGNELTLTVTSQVGTGASKGDKIVFTVESGKITLKSGAQFPYAQAPANGVYTNADFSL